MTDQVYELRKEVQQLLKEINNVIHQNLHLIRELEQLTAVDSQINTDLDKATQQFSTQMSLLNIKTNEDTSEINESSDIQAVTLSP